MRAFARWMVFGNLLTLVGYSMAKAHEGIPLWEGRLQGGVVALVVALILIMLREEKR